MMEPSTGDAARPSPFARLHATWLLLALLVGSSIPVIALLHGPYRVSLDDRVAGLVAYSAALVVMLGAGWFTRVDWRRLFGPPVTRQMLPLAAVVVPVGLLTMAFAIMVYVPLSYVAPGFVQRTLLDADGLTRVSTPGQWLLLVLVAVVAAPVVEELLFRGLLMHRWTHKWGTTTGVVASSVLFAIGHQEWVGHFVFGVALCLLYLHTRTLWMPILAHAVNNAAATITTIPSAFLHQADPPETMAEFRAGAWILVPLLLGGLVTGWLYLRRFFPEGWRPVLGRGVPYDGEG